ncbi:MAG: V-type ATPase subunit [Spirochaetales bacterium]|nr:V-type ATPase subunit [Spirochaetales bacterium]
MAGPLEKYAFIAAKLRTKLSKILSADFLARLISSHSLVEAIQLLRDTDFSQVDVIYEKTGDLKMGELELFKQEIKLFEEVIRYVSGDVADFCRALLMRYEIDNLKNILRLWFDRVVRKREIEEASSYIYREKIIRDLHVEQLLNAENIENIPEILSDSPYGLLILENSEQIKLKNSLFSLEIALDKYYYKQLLLQVSMLSTRDAEIANRLIGVEIDMHNINWIVRFKTLYDLSLEDTLSYIIPFGHSLNQQMLGAAFQSEGTADIISDFIKKKYANLSPLIKIQGSETHSRLVLVERLLEEIMRYEVKRVLMGNPFTIGIILAYFVLKKWEIKKVMTILNAKLYGIEAERIRDSL